MKRFLPLLLVVFSSLGASAVVAYADCPDIIVTSDGTECRLVGETSRGSCAYSCS